MGVKTLDELQDAITPLDSRDYLRVKLERAVEKYDSKITAEKLRVDFRDWLKKDKIDDDSYEKYLLGLINESNVTLNEDYKLFDTVIGDKLDVALEAISDFMEKNRLPVGKQTDYINEKNNKNARFFSSEHVQLLSFLMTGCGHGIVPAAYANTILSEFGHYKSKELNKPDDIIFKNYETNKDLAQEVNFFRDDTLVIDSSQSNYVYYGNKLVEKDVSLGNGPLIVGLLTKQTVGSVGATDQRKFIYYPSGVVTISVDLKKEILDNIKTEERVVYEFGLVEKTGNIFNIEVLPRNINKYSKYGYLKEVKNDFSIPNIDTFPINSTGYKSYVKLGYVIFYQQTIRTVEYLRIENIINEPWFFNTPFGHRQQETELSGFILKGEDKQALSIESGMFKYEGAFINRTIDEYPAPNNNNKRFLNYSFEKMYNNLFNFRKIINADATFYFMIYYEGISWYYENTGSTRRLNNEYIANTGVVTIANDDEWLIYLVCIDKLGKIIICLGKEVYDTEEEAKYAAFRLGNYSLPPKNFTFPIGVIIRKSQETDFRVTDNFKIFPYGKVPTPKYGYATEENSGVVRFTENPRSRETTTVVSPEDLKNYHDWNNKVIYRQGELIYYNDETYIALKQNLGKQPDTSLDDWSSLEKHITDSVKIKNLEDEIKDNKNKIQELLEKIAELEKGDLPMASDADIKQIKDDIKDLSTKVTNAETEIQNLKASGVGGSTGQLTLECTETWSLPDRVNDILDIEFDRTDNVNLRFDFTNPTNITKTKSVFGKIDKAAGTFKLFYTGKDSKDFVTYLILNYEIYYHLEDNGKVEVQLEPLKNDQSVGWGVWKTKYDKYFTIHGITQIKIYGSTKANCDYVSNGYINKVKATVKHLDVTDSLLKEISVKDINNTEIKLEDLTTDNKSLATSDYINVQGQVLGTADVLYRCFKESSQSDFLYYEDNNQNYRGYFVSVFDYKNTNIAHIFSTSNFTIQQGKIVFSQKSNIGNELSIPFIIKIPAITDASVISTNSWEFIIIYHSNKQKELLDILLKHATIKVGVDLDNNFYTNETIFRIKYGINIQLKTLSNAAYNAFKLEFRLGRLIGFDKCEIFWDKSGSTCGHISENIHVSTKNATIQKGSYISINGGQIESKSIVASEKIKDGTVSKSLLDDTLIEELKTNEFDYHKTINWQRPDQLGIKFIYEFHANNTKQFSGEMIFRSKINHLLVKRLRFGIDKTKNPKIFYIGYENVEQENFLKVMFQQNIPVKTEDEATPPNKLFQIQLHDNNDNEVEFYIIPSEASQSVGYEYDDNNPLGWKGFFNQIFENGQIDQLIVNASHDFTINPQSFTTGTLTDASIKHLNSPSTNLITKNELEKFISYKIFKAVLNNAKDGFNTLFKYNNLFTSNPITLVLTNSNKTVDINIEFSKVIENGKYKVTILVETDNDKNNTFHLPKTESSYGKINYYGKTIEEEQELQNVDGKIFSSVDFEEPLEITLELSKEDKLCRFKAEAIRFPRRVATSTNFAKYYLFTTVGTLYNKTNPAVDDIFGDNFLRFQFKNVENTAIGLIKLDISIIKENN